MSNKFTMAIGGDFVPTENNQKKLVAGDINGTFGDVAELFKNADFSFLNVECALTKRGTPIEKCGPNLRADPDSLLTLQKMGVKLLGFSNNHSLDWGRIGLEDSIEAAKKYGIPHVGCGMNITQARQPYFFEKNGVKCCIIAVAENEATIASATRAGANPFDPFDTIEDIEAAKKSGYKVVVIYHGGKEMYDMTSPQTRRRFHKMAQHGADFIFAQHTHCICCHEEYMGCQICYGQANTLFELKDFIDHAMWKCGLLPLITIGKKNEVEYIPFTVNDGAISIAKGKDRDDIMIPFEERSKILNDDDAFQKRWIDFMVPCGEKHLRFLTDLDENGQTLEPHTMSVLANFLRCEIHNEVLQSYAHYKLIENYGNIKVDGQS